MFAKIHVDNLGSLLYSHCGKRNSPLLQPTETKIYLKLYKSCELSN